MQPPTAQQPCHRCHPPSTLAHSEGEPLPRTPALNLQLITVIRKGARWQSGQRQTPRIRLGPCYPQRCGYGSRPPPFSGQMRDLDSKEQTTSRNYRSDRTITSPQLWTPEPGLPLSASPGQGTAARVAQHPPSSGSISCNSRGGRGSRPAPTLGAESCSRSWPDPSDVAASENLGPRAATAPWGP